MTRRKHNEDETPMEPAVFTANARGFVAYTFRDIYDAEASIQESSLATEDAIWLGLDAGTHKDGLCMARMHLSRPMAKWLIKQLQFFVKHGWLDRPLENTDAAP